MVSRMLRDIGAEVIDSLRSAISCLVRLCAIKSAAIVSITEAIGSEHNVDTHIVVDRLRSHCTAMFERSLYRTVWDGPYTLLDEATVGAQRDHVIEDIHTSFDDKVTPLEPAVKDMFSGIWDDCNRLALVCEAMSSYATDKAAVHTAMVPLTEIYRDMITQLVSPEASLIQMKRLATITARYKQLRDEGIGADDAHRAVVIESMAKLNKA